MNHHGLAEMIRHISTDPIPTPVYHIINHLKSLPGLVVSRGLTNQEISSIESSFGFSFPPDLRLILETGLPVGAHFPNWRSGSNRNHLRLLFSLPLLHVSKMVAKNELWVDRWGIRPGSNAEALAVVKKLMEMAPIMVPVYGDFYVPSTTMLNVAGNPVFRIDSDGVRVWSCDVVGFLQGLNQSGDFVQINPSDTRRPRRVEFWSEVAAERGKVITTCEWWRPLSSEKLKACLDDAFWKLREGGWTEQEVREMMMMTTVHRQSHDIVYAFDEGDGDICADAPEDDHKGSEVTTLRHLLYSLEA